jgi:allantoinase
MSQESAFRFVRARIPTEHGPREASVSIRDGVIVSVDGPAQVGAGDVDLGGVWLLPGVVDGHVHFDDPGFTRREDFSSGTRAAAAGGVTTVVDMPCTSLPPVTDGDSFDGKLAVVSPKAHVDFRFWGGVRGNSFDVGRLEARLDGLVARGVRSIKTYLISGMDTFEDLSPDQLRSVLLLAKQRGLVVGVHAEDKDLVQQGTARARQAADGDSPAAYARARSAEAEAAGVATCIRLAEETGAALHVVHLACGDGLRQIRAAKARGVSVTVETCPHYLAFTEGDLDRLGGLLKTAPVVKDVADRDALWEGLADGTIDMVATDHAPGCFPEEKITGSIWTDYGGVPGVELLLPFLMSEGVRKGRISLWRAVELLCGGPARVHALSNKGRIEKGMDADFVVFDPDRSHVVRAAEMVTRQKYTPFEGTTLTGRVRSTYVRGVLVYDEGRGILGEPRGRLV